MVTLVALPLLGLRASGVLPPPAAASARTRRRTGWGMALLGFLSWVFQLHRFGLD